MIAFIVDEFPQLLKHKVKVLIAYMTVCFLCGLPWTCNGGVHIFTLIDNRGTVGNLWCCISQVNPVRYLTHDKTFITHNFVLTQTIAIAWIYGIHNFLSDIKEMNLWMPRGMEYVWAFLWTIAIPCLLIYMYVDSIVDMAPLRYGAYEYPDYINFVGLILVLLPVIIMAIYAAWFVGWALYKRLTWKEFVQVAFKPTDHWWKLRQNKFAVQIETDDEDDDKDEIEVESESVVKYD